MTLVNTETGEVVESVGSEVRARVSDITVKDRHRLDFGDIEGLARSISELGLIQPIIINPDFELIAGERRLRAFESLGRIEIPARVVANLDDAVARLKAERDENTCRKEMTVTELVTIGKRLEELERPKAAERRAEGLALGPKARSGEWSGSREPNQSEPQGRAADAVADALGVSRAHYERAKKVIDATDDDDPDVAEAAKNAAAEMERTGKVKPAHDKVQAARRKKATPVEKPKAPPKHGPRKKHLQIIDSIATSASGLAVAAREITELDKTVTSEEAARLRGDLSRSLEALRDLNNLLKERTK